jgi:transposase
MGTSRYVYNKSLNHIREKGNAEINFYRLRNKFVTAKNNPDINEWENLTPKDVRAGAIRDLVKAYKTAFSQLKSGNINKFNIEYRRKGKESTLEIPKSAIKYKDGALFIYKTYMGEKIKTCKEKIPEINYDCRLQYIRKQWYLIIPIKVTSKNTDHAREKFEACALDPGVRKFQTIYSENKIEKIMIRKEQVRDLQKKLDTFKSLRDKKKITKRRYKNRENRIYNKLDHLIDDLHFKTINSLVDEYKLIFLPIFESQEIARKNKYGNRNLLQLKHYTFRSRLSDRCRMEKDTTLILCTEEYTSKTCTRCGVLNNVGLSEIYCCSSCNLVIDRDVNGARNIFIKCISNM